MKWCVLMALVLFIGAASAEETEYHFRKTTWGMSREQVVASEQLEITLDTDRVLVYEARILDLDCAIYYIFADNQLVRTKYWFTEKHSSNAGFILDMEKVKNVLIKKYGEPQADKWTYYESSSFYIDNPEARGLGLATGEVQYCAQWYLGKTIISLLLAGDNYQITHQVQYSSPRHEALEESIKDREAQEDF